MEKYKIGDYVECTYTKYQEGIYAKSCHNLKGNRGYITETNGNGYYKIHFDKSIYLDEDGFYEYCCFEKDIKLVTR